MYLLTFLRLILKLSILDLKKKGNILPNLKYTRPFKNIIYVSINMLYKLTQNQSKILNSKLLFKYFQHENKLNIAI